MRQLKQKNSRIYLADSPPPDNKRNMNKGSQEDADDDPMKKNNLLCNIVVTNTTIKSYNVFLNESIGEAWCYNNLLDLLHNAKDDDVIDVHFNNGGGYIHVACQLVAAFLKTKAHTIGHLDASASSAASLIFLSMKEYNISSFADMLCHYYTSFLYGKGNEIEQMSDFQKKHLRSIFTTMYEGFLTTDELERMFKGEDFLFNGTEIKRRLDRRNNFIADKSKKPSRKKK